jgi:hypothetical protein
MDVDSQAMLQKTGVFWHEAGHFVAQQLNAQFFVGLGTVHLSITRRELPNQNFDYEGETLPVQPLNYSNNDRIQHPASMVASAVYGCFFQCTRCRIPLKACLEARHMGVHGYNDYEKVVVAQRRCLSTPESRDLVDKCIEEYFNKLQFRPEMAELFSQDVSNYVSSQDATFYIDLPDLITKLTTFMEAHKDFYLEFVEKLELLFRTYTP